MTFDVELLDRKMLVQRALENINIFTFSDLNRIEKVEVVNMLLILLRVECFILMF